MKKNRLFIGISMCTLMLAVGCSKDEEFLPSGNSSTETVSINVNSTLEAVGGSPTRATLASDAITPIWEREDKIAAIVDNGTPVELSLISGAGSDKGSFSGDIPATGEKMYFYYPTAAASDQGVDLTTQDASNTKEMVMFASVNYSTTPSIAFQNKTSILKLNMPIPAELGWNESTKLSATIYGAYSKGKLTKEGKWSELKASYIKLSGLKVTSDGLLTGYAVVIPGSKVTDLKVLVSDGTSSYMTGAYTNAEATIPQNNVVSINRKLTTAVFLWEPQVTSSEDVTSFLGDKKDLAIWSPADLGEVDIKELKNALEGKMNINLTLLNQKTILDRMFYECTSLNTVSLPEATSIESFAFYQCKNLTSVSLPEATSIGSIAFSNCTNLTSASLPVATNIGYSAFCNCTNLTSASLPEATRIESSAFYQCKLTSVFLPKATRIETFAFNGCTNLTSVHLPEVTSIDREAFSSCTNLTSVSIPKATSIGDLAFSWCTNLTSVSLPEATSIGKGVFSNCTNLTSVSLPEATSIGDLALDNCTNLTSVHLPKAYLIGDAFTNCTNLTCVFLPKATTIARNAFLNSPKMKLLVVPSYTSSLGFEINAEIKKKITVVANPTARWFGAESDWEYLMKAPWIFWNPGTTKADDVLKTLGSGKSLVISSESDLLNKDFDELKSALQGKTDISISLLNQKEISGDAFKGSGLGTIIAPSATSVEIGAFNGCTSLTKVFLPEVRYIVRLAFRNCTNLGTIFLPNVLRIADNAFYGCSSLKDVFLPKVTEIVKYAFYSCTNLGDISLPEVTEIGESAFSNCTTLGSISMPKATKVGAKAFYECSSLTDVSLPEVTEIGESAFSNCTTLGSISMPKATKVGNYAFSECSLLASASISKAIEVGEGAFYLCKKLGSIYLPNATKVGAKAFYNCSLLSNVTLTQAKSVGSWAFFRCFKLLTIELPQVTTLEESLLQQCTKLVSASFPQAINIKDNVFYVCESLENLYLPRVENAVMSAFAGCHTEKIYVTVKAGSTWLDDVYWGPTDKVTYEPAQ